MFLYYEKMHTNVPLTLVMILVFNDFIKQTDPVLGVEFSSEFPFTELFIVTAPVPLEATAAELREMLTMRGFDFLAATTAGTLPAGLAQPASHRFLLAAAAQDLQPSPARSDKAARQLIRRFRTQKAQVARLATAAETALMIKSLFPADSDAIRARACAGAEAFRPPYAVLQQLGSHAARSRVDVVDFRGTRAVCKTFRLSALDFLQRELAARQRLAGLPEVTPILEVGDNYFVMPYYPDAWQWREDGLGLFPLARARACFALLRKIHARGCAVLDAHPGAFLFEGDAVRIADLEYLADQPAGTDFSESFDVKGPPPGFSGVLPAGRAVTYEDDWRKVLGVSLAELSGEGSLTMKRFAFLLCRLPKRLFKRLKKAVLRAARQGQGSGIGSFVVYRA